MKVVVMDRQLQLLCFNPTKPTFLKPYPNRLILHPFGAPKPIPTRSCRFPSGILCKGIKCSMKSYRLSELTQTEVESLKARPRIDFSSIFSTVQPIVDDVHKRGDAAVKDYTAKFDKVELEQIIVKVSKLPDPVLDAVIREAFDVAYDNIYAFHAAQKSAEKCVENMKGVKCKRVARSISSVGLYVSGGTAVLPSTALMLSVPAQIAGCKTVVLATPPSQDGSICKEVLYCAKKAGVTHILKAGGAQAISAMAWGTETCPKNSEAMISIDMPAGPLEVLVIADSHANPVHVASDLLSQSGCSCNLRGWCGFERYRGGNQQAVPKPSKGRHCFKSIEPQLQCVCS